MKSYFNKKKIQYMIKEQWTTVLTMVVLCVIIALVFFSYKSLNDAKSQLEVLEAESTLLKNRTDTLKYNKNLTQDQIDTYNKILAALIPESEDFFSIIYALDMISRQTGFIITDYTINLANTSKDKISLVVEGKGDTEAFLTFLKNYHVSGNRLITSEKIDYSGTKVTNTKIVLNLYNKKFAFHESVVPQLTTKDVATLDKIKEKVSLSFMDETESGDYETRPNPF